MRKQNLSNNLPLGLRAEGLVPAVGDGNPEALTTFLEKLQPTLPAGSTTKNRAPSLCLDAKFVSQNYEWICKKNWYLLPK